MHEKLSWNFPWAALCMTGAVYFIFHDWMCVSYQLIRRRV